MCVLYTYLALSDNEDNKLPLGLIFSTHQNRRHRFLSCALQATRHTVPPNVGKQKEHYNRYGGEEIISYYNNAHAQHFRS